VWPVSVATASPVAASHSRARLPLIESTFLQIEAS
jgi:hypothetical protein